MPIPPFPILGSGMWAWTIDKKTVFELLDTFYEAGYRQVDMATNYPINKNPQDWRAAEKILAEWIYAHKIQDLKIWIKVGSLNNLFSPEHNLQPSFLYLALDYYQNLYKNNLHTFGIHWDNRNALTAIEETLAVLKKIMQSKLSIGLSGIQYPNLYAQVNEAYHVPLRIQIKHNVIYSDYKRYAPLHTNASFTAYGINAGGLKLNPTQYRPNGYYLTRGGDLKQEHPALPKIRDIIVKANQNTSRPPLKTFHQLSLLYAYYAPQMESILLGASSVKQLKNSLSFIHKLKKYDYSDIKLVGIVA